MRRGLTFCVPFQLNEELAGEASPLCRENKGWDSSHQAFSDSEDLHDQLVESRFLNLQVQPTVGPVLVYRSLVF